MLPYPIVKSPRCLWPTSMTSGAGAAESNRASRFPGNFCDGGSLISTTWTILSPPSESKEVREVTEETEEAGDRTRGGVAGVRTLVIGATDMHSAATGVGSSSSSSASG